MAVISQLNIGGTNYDILSRNISSPDTRSVAINANTLTAAQNAVQFDFKQKSTIAHTLGDPYYGVMTYRPYGNNSDWSGGPAHQISFSNSGLARRISTGDTTWGSWYNILDSNNYTGILDDRYRSPFVGLPYLYVYYAGSGDTSFSTSPIIFNTKVRDTHNAYSTSTGIFTCPIAGIYMVAVNYYSNAYTSAVRPRIWHANSSGTIYTDGGCQLNGQNTVSCTDIFYCVAGDRLYFGPQASNWPLSLYAANGHNSMAIACLRPL